MLRAARDAGVKRVVLTSSFVAIGYGHEKRATPFDETSWTPVGAKGVLPYAKSKMIAERATWKFIAAEGRGLELAVANPVGTFGPLLGPDYSTSITLVKRLLDGSVPGCAKLCLGLVDVRDVARMMRMRLGAAAARVPTRELPNWLLRLSAPFDPEARFTAEADFAE